MLRRTPHLVHFVAPQITILEAPVVGVDETDYGNATDCGAASSVVSGETRGGALKSFFYACAESHT